MGKGSEVNSSSLFRLKNVVPGNGNQNKLIPSKARQKIGYSSQQKAYLI
jgi:hypothetical protein